MKKGRKMINAVKMIGSEIKIGGGSHHYIMGGADSVPFCVLSIAPAPHKHSFLSNHIKISFV